MAELEMKNLSKNENEINRERKGKESLLGFSFFSCRSLDAAVGLNKERS